MKTKKLTVLIAIAIVVGIAATAFFGVQTLTSQGNSDTSNTIVVTTTAGAPVLQADRFGPIVSLLDARTLSGANFQPPQYLPFNLSLTQARAEKDAAALIYSSPSLGAAPNYVGNVSMIVVVLNDGTSYSFPSSPTVIITQVHSCTSIRNSTVTCTDTFSTTTQPQRGPVPVKLTVSGHPGWGVDYGNEATVTWWSNGVHYGISAPLPLQVLVDIAQSMNT